MRWWRSRRALRLELAAAPAPPPEVVEAVLAAAPGLPWLAVVDHMLSSAIVAASQEALGAELASEARAYHVGGVDHLGRLKAQLGQGIAAARRAQRERAAGESAEREAEKGDTDY